jgi:thiamine monophosphate synthase
MVGNVFPTSSHPDRPGAGVELVARAARLGRPVIAVGGVTPERCGDLCAAGAWGVAAIRGLWYAPDPAAAARAYLAPWLEDA